MFFRILILENINFVAPKKTKNKTSVLFLVSQYYKTYIKLKIIPGITVLRNFY